MSTIRLVVPDAGPLITLADLLEALLVFRKDVRIVLTDYVEFEVTRRRKTRAEDRHRMGGRHRGRRC
jgi:hypothetical protein